MKKGNIYEGKVSAIAFPNKGIVNVDGERVVIKNALPGQTVSFILSKNKIGSKEGRLLEVLERSETEDISRACSVFGKCGGCLYQTLPYEEESRIKEGQIRMLFDNFLRSRSEYVEVSTEDFLESIKPSPISAGYRNKMEYSFGDEVKGGEMTLGMHVSGHFNDIVNTDGCNISDPDFEIIRKFTLSFFKDTGFPFYHKNSGEGFLRHLLLRKGIKTGEILVCIVTTSSIEAGNEMKDFCDGVLSLQTAGNITGVINIINDSPADAVKADDMHLLYGREWFFDEVCGLRFRITPFSFFQTNTLGAEVLYGTVAEYVKDAVGDGKSGGTVFDLYCGTGTIAQIVSRYAKKAVGVELVEEAVQAAKKNAEKNGIENAEFIAGDVLKVLEGLDEKPDLIIMDPPREGATPKALAKILDYGVKNIIYISCKPTSLMRDLALFTDAGYRIKRAVPVDMFPRTGSVETVCLLSQRKPDTTIEVDLDISELEVSSAETKATYEEIKSYVLEKYGLKVSNLYIAQVKRECGIVERINYNLPKTEGNRVPQCPEDKRKAIKDAFIHFQMI